MEELGIAEMKKIICNVKQFNFSEHRCAFKNGNIRGITKFKLLRSNTRGVLEDEILNEILRNLNFIAPRTEKLRRGIKLQLL